MKPTLDDFLCGSAQWHGEHQGIRYKLSWHGRSEYSPEGTWCWYIYVTDEQFYPDDWAKLRLTREDKEWPEGSWRRHYNYDNFPDIDPHCGWTWGEMKTYLGREGTEHEMTEVGCDYAHLWDRESGFWQGREDIERDVKCSIDKLVEMFPKRRERCAYTGRYDDSEQFYTARNGSRVHKTQADKFEDGWAAWRPAEKSVLNAVG